MGMGTAGKTQSIVNTTTVADGDSIASYLADGSGNFLTSQTIQAVRRLDVNIASERAEDSVHTSGDYGVFSLGVRNDAGTALAADGDYIPFTMDSTGALRTTASFTAAFDFVYPEDSSHVTADPGAFILGVRNDAAATTFTGTNGDYSPIAVDSAGRVFVSFSGIFAEDSVHVDADSGMHILAVRQDTTASNVGTTGDYSSLQTWSNGDLKVVDNCNLSNLQQVVTVGTTAVALPTTALANRKLIFIQNQSVNRVYLGSATVTTSGATAGFHIGNGGFVTVEAGPANSIFGIASAAGSAVSVWEHR